MDPSQLPPAQPATNYTRPEDPSQYIRTFAKDVAQLANTPLPQATAAQTAPVETTGAKGTDAPRTIQEQGVTLTDFDASPVNRGADASSPKEFKQEVVKLSQEDSDGIFAGAGTVGSTPATAPTPSPLMPQGAIAVAPSIAPVGEAPTAPRATAPGTEPERDTILARLRAKVEASRAANAAAYPSTQPEPGSSIPTAPPAAIPAYIPQAAITTPELAPIPEVEPELRLRTGAPDFSTTPAPTIPSPRDTLTAAKSNTLAGQLAAKDTTAGPSPLHTYSSDFAGRIDQQRSSTFSVLAAQSDAGQGRQAPQATRRTRPLVPLLAGGAMLVVGIGAIVGAYVFLRNAPSVPTLSSVPSLIAYDESVEIEGTGPELLQALDDAAQGTGVSGNVVVTYVTGQDASSTVPIAQPGGALIRRLSLGAPDILLRNLDDSSTVGYLKAGTESRPFFILRVNSYERTFAGMLAWERTLPDELAVIYPEYATQQTSSATSTLLVLPPAGPAFTDALVGNYDVRVLRDSAGRSRILYGYVNKDTLIIARDEAAFMALIGRLTATGGR